MKPDATLATHSTSVLPAEATPALLTSDSLMSYPIVPCCIWQCRHSGERFGANTHLQKTQSYLTTKAEMIHWTGVDSTVNLPGRYNRNVECIHKQWPPPLLSTNQGSI